MKIFVNLDYKKILFVRQKGFWLDMQGRGNPGLFYISIGVRKSPLQLSQCCQTYKFRELRHHEG